MKEKLEFRKNYLSLIKDVKFKLRSEVLDKYIDNRTFGSPEISYIAAFKDAKHLLTVEELAKKYEDMNIYWIKNEIIEIVYIESANDNIMFLAATKDYNPSDPYKYNCGNDSKITTEIKNAITEKNISSLEDFSFDTTENIMAAFETSISKRYSISMEELDYLKMINTQKIFVDNYNVYKTDKNQIETYDFTNYDHIKSFSLNYYIMIKVISDIYKSEESCDGFTIHDAGTNTSQLALMLSTLKENELMDLKVKEIIASDLVILCEDKSQQYISQFQTPKPIRFVEQDFTDESKDLPESDVTILNDVLEHFPTDEMSFHILQRFWKCTRKLLIVHVPQEEKPAPEWGHHITFNKQKLSEWASRLSGHISLENDYTYTKNNKCSDYGFLILKKLD